jgi:hypothetical protein
MLVMLVGVKDRRTLLAAGCWLLAGIDTELFEGWRHGVYILEIAM